MAGLPTIPRYRALIPKLNYSTHLPVKREGNGTPSTSNRGEESPGYGHARERRLQEFPDTQCTTSQLRQRTASSRADQATED
jgi:hypothetical protein